MGTVSFLGSAPWISGVPCANCSDILDTSCKLVLVAPLAEVGFTFWDHSRRAFHDLFLCAGDAVLRQAQKIQEGDHHVNILVLLDNMFALPTLFTRVDITPRWIYGLPVWREDQSRIYMPWSAKESAN